MNYIKLINAFYDRLETSSLSTSAIALWHALVHVNNKAGWPEEFTVAVSVLCVKTGLSERTISNARNDLKVAGYIDFRSRRGNKAAIYRVWDLSATITDKHSGDSTLPATDADNVSDNASDKRSGSASDNASALLNKTKQNETIKPQPGVVVDEGFAKLAKFYEENIGLLNSVIHEELDYMCDFLNPELALLALRESVVANATNKIKFTLGVLRNWKGRGYKTTADVESAETRRNNQVTKAKGDVVSLFEASPETLEKQKQDVERYANMEVDMGDLPY